jgi:hypothetical protein
MTITEATMRKSALDPSCHFAAQQQPVEPRRVSAELLAW